MNKKAEAIINNVRGDVIARITGEAAADLKSLADSLIEAKEVVEDIEDRMTKREQKLVKAIDRQERV